MKFREPTKPHRKSGVWGTRIVIPGREKRQTFDGASPRLFWPTYAGANMGHPFSVGVSERVDYEDTVQSGVSGRVDYHDTCSELV